MKHINSFELATLVLGTRLQVLALRRLYDGFQDTQETKIFNERPRLI